VSRPRPRLERVAVEQTSHDGRGVAHVDDKAVFVHGALAGELVDVQLRRRKRRFDEGDAVAVHEASPARVTPRCPVFGICGGCALQHMSPAAQRELKAGALTDALERIGRVTPDEVLPPLAGPVWHYRRRARLGVKYVPGKGGRVLVGFRERMSYLITDMDFCEVLVEGLARLIAPLAELIAGLSIRARVPQIEAAAGGEALALVLRVLDPPDADDRARLAAFAREHDVRLYLQPGGPDTVQPLAGDPGALHYALPEFGLELEFLPTDFIQINAGINAAMVGRVVELLDPRPEHRVLDLFCGLGNFSLALARRAGHVRGVEGDPALVSRAAGNARRNAIGNAAFISANLFDEREPRAWADGHFDRVVLDPPRAGALEVCRIMHRLGPARVVYVSCHPGTLARDAHVLVHEQGYTLSAAGVMDMFAHTAHVEAVAVFDRR